MNWIKSKLHINHETHNNETAQVNNTKQITKAIPMVKSTVMVPPPGAKLNDIEFEKNLDVLAGIHERVLKIPSDIGKYLYLRDLQIDNPQLYWPLLVRHGASIMPFIYTPTVGLACQEYFQLPVRQVGLFIQYPTDKGKIKEKLLQAQEEKGCDLRVIVVTDGERILGLGDQGAGGMGISEGKIQLYTACAGVPPEMCLPVTLDVGTTRETLLEDERYNGLKEIRLSKINRPEYDEFVDEFMQAVASFPHISLQFEDFGNSTAFNLLDKYQEKQCCFNDDIQGTASICCSAFISALRVTGVPLIDQRVVFLGCGEAAVGIGNLISMYFVKHTGMSFEEAKKRCYFLDSKGLVCKSRDNLAHHKLEFAHDVEYKKDLLSTIEFLQPTAIIGVSTIAKAFNQEVIELMCKINDRPIIFPLSNPTSKAECTFEECMEWSKGQAVFASGSPFPPMDVNGKTVYPAQANNAYIFPAVGLAAVALRSKKIDDEIFMVAAETLARLSTVDELAHGRLFPPFDHIQDISLKIAANVASYMVKANYALNPEEVATNKLSMREFIEKSIWKHTPELVSKF